jgi:hypothetical protein
MLSEKARGQQAEAESSDAPGRDGLTRMSDEGSVMELEQRSQAPLVRTMANRETGKSYGNHVKPGGFTRVHEPYDVRASRTVL